MNEKGVHFDSTKAHWLYWSKTENTSSQMSWTDQLYHVQTAVQVKTSSLHLNLEKKVSEVLSFQRKQLETEMHKRLHILTVHENYFPENQTSWLWIKTLYEYCCKMHFWGWGSIKYISEIALLPYLSFGDVINSVRFCWNSVLLFWHLKQDAFISKTVTSIMALQKPSFLIHIF